MMNGHLRRDMKSFKRGSLVAVWGRGQVSGRKAAARRKEQVQGPEAACARHV